MEPNKASIPNSEDRTPPYDNHMVCNAVLWITQSGTARYDLPERYGPWKTIYTRFCIKRDDDTLQAIINALNIDADYEKLSIDSTLLKAH